MNLQLSLKTKWFEMTKSGLKTEDYREINKYWFERLVFQHEKVFKYCTGVNYKSLDKDLLELYIQRIFTEKSFMVGFKPFNTNTMTLGYPKSSNSERILKLEHKGIEIGYGCEEWGAEPNKLYFIIKHGKQLNNN